MFTNKGNKPRRRVLKIDDSPGYKIRTRILPSPEAEDPQHLPKKKTRLTSQLKRFRCDIKKNSLVMEMIKY